MKITRREREVMKYVISGFSNKEIAFKMGLSTRTVETYLNRVYLKLGVSNKVSAAFVYGQLYRNIS